MDTVKNVNIKIGCKLEESEDKIEQSKKRRIRWEN